jgi:hypothetical protein
MTRSITGTSAEVGGQFTAAAPSFDASRVRPHVGVHHECFHAIAIISAFRAPRKKHKIATVHREERAREPARRNTRTSPLFSASTKSGVTISTATPKPEPIRTARAPTPDEGVNKRAFSGADFVDDERGEFEVKLGVSSEKGRDSTVVCATPTRAPPVFAPGSQWPPALRRVRCVRSEGSARSPAPRPRYGRGPGGTRGGMGKYLGCPSKSFLDVPGGSRLFISLTASMTNPTSSAFPPNTTSRSHSSPRVTSPPRSPGEGSRGTSYGPHFRTRTQSSVNESHNRDRLFRFDARRPFRRRREVNARGWYYHVLTKNTAATI